MISERTGSHLDQVASLIIQEKENLRRQKSAEAFVSQAKSIILDYGPTEYIRVDRKQKYRKLRCGTASTPTVEFPAPDGKTISVNLTAKIVGLGDNQYGEPRIIGINFKDDNDSSQFTVCLDSNGRIIPDTLPTLKDSQNGLLILHQIESDYRRRNLEIHEEPENWDHR